MPNSIIITASTQEKLDAAIAHNIVGNIDKVLFNPLQDAFSRIVDTLTNEPGINIKANKCAAVICQSCDEEVCAGCKVSFIFNIDDSNAICSNCTGPIFAQRFTPTEVPESPAQQHSTTHQPVVENTTPTSYLKPEIPIEVRDRLLEWAINGPTDLSSLAIARAFMHGSTGDQEPFPRQNSTFPRETPNLQSCILLIETVPEVRDAFTTLAESSQYWAELIANWEALTDSLRTDLDGDLNNKILDRRASTLFDTGYITYKTHVLMKQAFKQAARHYRRLSYERR